MKPYESTVVAGGAAIALFAGVFTAQFALVPMHETLEAQDSQTADLIQPPLPDQPALEASTPPEETAPAAPNPRALSIDQVADRGDESVRAVDDDAPVATGHEARSALVPSASTDGVVLAEDQTDTAPAAAESEIAPKAPDAEPTPPS